METPGETTPEMESSDRRFHPPSNKEQKKEHGTKNSVMEISWNHKNSIQVG
jgi:hypothetical protein